MEHRREDGKLEHGYYCPRCGKPCNMMGSGHGKGKCKPNPELVEKLNKANREEQGNE